MFKPNLFILSSVIASNLDKAKILSSGKELPQTPILDITKLKGFADDKFNVA